MKFKITVIPKQKHKNFPVLPLWIFNLSSLGSYFFSSFFSLQLRMISASLHLIFCHYKRVLLKLLVSQHPCCIGEITLSPGVSKEKLSESQNLMSSLLNTPMVTLWSISQTLPSSESLRIDFPEVIHILFSFHP